jgi:putative RecB family exonuclease
VPSAQSTRGLEVRAKAIWSAVELACQREDFRPKPSRLCDYCAFKDYCPAFGGDPSLVPSPALATPLAPPAAVPVAIPA